LQLLAQCSEHVARGDESQVDQDLADFVAATFALNFERAGEGPSSVIKRRSMRISPSRILD
jgi:hypothetical protein